jgi:CRP-like cAMP-binding protein
MHPHRIALLQAMPIFGAIDESTLDFLVERARMHRVRAGASFFHEGDAATGMFVLEVGRVAVSRHRPGGDVVFGELGPGDCFGEMALMDLQPRSATVAALEDCRAFEIGPGDLIELFERDLAQFTLIQMNMGREVCRRLRAADERLLALEAGRNSPPRPGAV